MNRRTLAFIVALIALAPAWAGDEPATKDRLALAVEELRGSIGEWEAVTEFLNEDGSVARKAEGTYELEWVVPDRVAAGKSHIPDLEQTSGLLFYVNEKRGVIEMVSVGADGNLWTMTGPAGEETRYSQTYKTAAGNDGQLRFTRYNVSKDAFESRMEYTEDGGNTWKPGNHQAFRRVKAASDWPWPDSADAMTAAPDSHRVLLENESVRVLEVILKAGEKEPMHTHRWPSTMIVDRSSRIRYYGADGKPTFETPADRPITDEIFTNWLGPEGLHAVENIGRRSFHAIRVELKE